MLLGSEENSRIGHHNKSYLEGGKHGVRLNLEQAKKQQPLILARTGAMWSYCSLRNAYVFICVHIWLWSGLDFVLIHVDVLRNCSCPTDQRPSCEGLAGPWISPQLFTGSPIQSPSAPLPSPTAIPCHHLHSPSASAHIQTCSPRGSVEHSPWAVLKYKTPRPLGKLAHLYLIVCLALTMRLWPRPLHFVRFSFLAFEVMAWVPDSKKPFCFTPEGLKNCVLLSPWV